MYSRIYNQELDISNPAHSLLSSYSSLSSLHFQKPNLIQKTTRSQLKQTPQAKSSKMARTKFTGDKPKPTPPPEPAPPTAAQHREPTPHQAAMPKAPGMAKISKPKGTCKFSKKVLILYEALKYGVDQRVSTDYLKPRCPYIRTNIQYKGRPRRCGPRNGHEHPGRPSA